MGLAAATVVAATAAGGVLWYQKNNTKNYIINMFIEACQKFNDSDSGTICIETFYNLGNPDDNTLNFLKEQNTEIQKQTIKEIYDDADKMVKKEINVKSIESLNEYPDDSVDSVLHKLQEHKDSDSNYLTRLFAYFRLTCYFVSFDCFVNNEWVREKYKYNNMMLSPRFLERFLSLCFQFDDKFNFEFYKRIETVELHNNIESYAIYAHPGGIVLENATFDLLLNSILNYQTNVVDKKKFEMQKECLKHKYEKLNTDLHSRMNTQRSAEAAGGAVSGAGTGAWTGMPTTSQTHVGRLLEIPTSGQQQTGAAASRFEVDQDVLTSGAGEANNFKDNQDVWYKPMWIRQEYPAKILKVPRWPNEKYEIEYTNDRWYNSFTNQYESKKTHLFQVENYSLRPRLVDEQPRQY